MSELLIWPIKKTMPYPIHFRVFGGNGWDTMLQIKRNGSVTQGASWRLEAARLASASYVSNEPANLLTRYHREAVANLLNG
jgi:hypothetical protein